MTTLIAIFLMLSWQAAGRSANVYTQYNSTHTLHIHASLSKVILGLDTSWALLRLVTIALNSHQTPFGPIISMQQLSLMFPTHVTQFRILFNGSQSLKHHYQVCTVDRNKESLYWSNRAPPSGSCSSSWGWLLSLMQADSYGHHHTVGLCQRLMYCNGELKARQGRQQGSGQQKIFAGAGNWGGNTVGINYAFN